MKKWYAAGLFNLLVLALLGLALRYKINFPLPFIQQENLLHAHSHFAFNGWISFLLQLLILEEFTGNYKKNTRFWNRFFIISTIVNYAMIISFTRVGYSGVSIVLSTFALWLSYVFAYKIYKAIPDNKKKAVSIKFTKASLFFLLLSSLGPYALAIIMAVKSSHQYWYHNALYFFLHFQYNGWLRGQQVIPGSALRAGLNKITLRLTKDSGPVAVRTVELQLKHHWRHLDYKLSP